MKSKKPKTVKTKSKKDGKKSTGKRRKKSGDFDDSGIVVIDDNLEIDTEKELEERRAYLEEARSQDSTEQLNLYFILLPILKHASIMLDYNQAWYD